MIGSELAGCHLPSLAAPFEAPCQIERFRKPDFQRIGQIEVEIKLALLKFSSPELGRRKRPERRINGISDAVCDVILAVRTAHIISKVADQIAPQATDQRSIVDRCVEVGRETARE